MVTDTKDDGHGASPVDQAAASDEREAVVAALRGLVPGLAEALGTAVEVVLHDLSLLPNSIVTICNDLTGRTVGDPATDVLLKQLRSGGAEHLIGYGTAVGGRVLQSSTLLVRDSAGTPVAALCLNADVTDWKMAQALLERISTGRQLPPRRGAPIEEPSAVVDPEVPEREAFAHSVDELTKSMIENAVDAVGVPVDLMKKQHKLAVVRDLEGRGLFLVKAAVESTAAALQVSRFTIYNYLNEITADREDGGAGERSVQ